MNNGKHWHEWDGGVKIVEMIQLVDKRDRSAFGIYAAVNVIVGMAIW